MEQSPRERATDPEVLEVGSTAPAAEPSPDAQAEPFAAPSAAGAPGAPGAPGHGVRRGRRRLLVTAGVLSVALGGGGGPRAASRRGGGGASPAEAVPASALGFVSVDLDPSVDQKLDAFRFARKFPEAADRLG